MQTSTEGLAGNIVAANQLEAIIEQTVKGFVKSNPRSVARALIRHLRERNFILCFLGGDSYGFVHRTFLEYFCADDLRWRFDHEKSIDLQYLKHEVYGAHWRDGTWHEVLCLLCGMIHPQAIANLLEFLLDEKGRTYQHIFLATECLGEVRKRSDLGSVELVALEQVRALVRFYKDSHNYPTDWATPSSENDAHVRARAVVLVAQVWRESKETYRWLRNCALPESDAAVRRVAVEQLARGWRDHPETLEWLNALTESDVDLRSG